MHDAEIINGLTGNYQQRAHYEKAFYLQYEYLIREGCRKYKLNYEDSFSAYSDALLSAIHNIIDNRFDKSYSLKTYLYQIFHHKCVDLIRKITNNKQQVHQSVGSPALLIHLPEGARNAVEQLIDQERITTIKQHLETIGIKCKEVLLLHADGYNDQQIADQLAYNNAAVVKTTRLRCREKLNKLLEGYE
jgi:RNA polymerase sigma factor (sigma-70 family)